MKLKTRNLHRRDAENAEAINSSFLCDLGVSAVRNPYWVLP